MDFGWLENGTNASAREQEQMGNSLLADKSAAVGSY
jgi:hypothetical protein